MSEPKTALTIEQMREIVAAANLLKGYRDELAQLEENLATGNVDWLALPPFMAGLDQVFTRMRSPETTQPAKDPARKAQKKKPKSARARKPTPPTDAPEDDKKPRPSTLKYTVEGMTGTLAELCVHHGKDYNLAYDQVHRHRPAWSIEQALGLQPPPDKKGVNGVPLTEARPNHE